MNLLVLHKTIIILFFIIYTSSNSCGLLENNSNKLYNGFANSDTCDNPDADINCCFINMPPNISNVIKAADDSEKGERLFIKGVVYKSDGKTPCPDVLIYVYHTDNNGYYSKRGDETGFQKWHVHLHGWGKTNKDGKYEIHSIRPAPYPDNSMPAHIHSAIKEPDNLQPYYINDFVFSDDPLVTEKYISSQSNPGGSGVVDLMKDNNGTWIGKRDIVLKK